MKKKISVAICTLNRADYLRKALKSLTEQTLETDAFEILVIDNNSTDQTKEVATEEFAHIPNLKYIFEPILGLSQARNTGLKHAESQYIAYLDDDAIASPSWLEKILHAFNTVEPQPGCIGGEVAPIWEAPRPDWLSDGLLPFLTIVNWSKEPCVLDANKYIAGANMSFPTALLKKIGGFSSELGRKGKQLLSNEEILIRDQLKNKGYTLFYQPDISVKHHVPTRRLAQEWFLSRMYWQGLSDASLLIHKKSPSYQERAKIAASEIKRFLKSPKAIKNLIMPANKADTFQRKCSETVKAGYIWGLLKP